jgi:hypothetical protein
MTTPAQKQTRWDSGDTYFVSNQLQKIDPNSYYHLVPGIVGRTVMPPVEGISPNLPSYTFDMTKLVGTTKRRGPKSRSAPTANVVKTRETHQILTQEESFGWTVDEVRAARETNQKLPEDRQLSAITLIEQWIDGMLCTGAPEANVYGIANNPGIGNTSAAQAWTAATADQIMASLDLLLSEADAALKQARVPGSTTPMYNQWVLMLSNARYGKLERMRLGATNEITLLTYIKANFSSIKKIVPWWRLDTANAVAVNGTNAMGVLAPALDNGSINPMAGGALVPLDYEQLPEQYEGRNVIVPAAGKCGGFVPRHGVAFRTFKGI